MKNIKFAMPSLKDARMRKSKIVPTIRYTVEEKYKTLGLNKSYAIFTYGCQGNEADSEVMAGILEEIGYEKSSDPMNADLVILNTCAIRENAEQRIWGVLGQLMGGIALFPAELVQSQIDKIFTWKNGKDHFAHKSPHLAFLFGKSICFPLFSAISFLNQVIMNKKRLKNIIYQNAT